METENKESKKDLASETEELESTPIVTPPPEPKSSPVATPPMENEKAEPKSSPVVTQPIENEKAEPPRVGDNSELEIVITEKRMALIKAWEENEKTKADNKAYTKISEIGAWENTKRAAIEADLKQIEADIEIEKAKEREKMKNKMAAIHKEAEEKRALVEAKKGQDIIKVQEAAAKFRSMGTLPGRLFKCFGY